MGGRSGSRFDSGCHIIVGVRRVASAATSVCRRDGACVLDAGRGVGRRPYDCRLSLHPRLESGRGVGAHGAADSRVDGPSLGRAGLYVNYAFIALWVGDAALWWHDRASYERRSARARDALLAVFLFMFVNAGVVFAHGPARVVGTIAVGMVLLARLVFGPFATRSYLTNGANER